MGLLEPITHREEIESLLNEAETKYNNAVKRFDNEKKKTTRKVDKLNAIKVDSWKKTMPHFEESFGAFKNIFIESTELEKFKLQKYSDNPKELLLQIRQTYDSSQSVANQGTTTIGVGATMGLIGTKLPVFGTLAAPILIFGAVFTAAKSKRELEKAKSINAQAMEKVAEIEVIVTGMIGIQNIVENYNKFIIAIQKKFVLFLVELDKIRTRHSISEDGFIDFNDLSYIEQKTLHVTWLFAQLIYQVLSAPIITDSGNVSDEAQGILNSASSDYKAFEKEACSMKGDDALIGDIMWSDRANLMMIIGVIVSCVYIACAYFSIKHGIIHAVKFIVPAVISFPYMYIIKNLSAGQLYWWRIAKIIISVITLVLLLYFGRFI